MIWGQGLLGGLAATPAALMNHNHSYLEAMMRGRTAAMDCKPKPKNTKPRITRMRENYGKSVYEDMKTHINEWLGEW